MIKVRILCARGEVRSIAIQGHALSGEKGSDLVCAGVSACYCGAVSALENRYQTIAEKHAEGRALVEVKGQITPHDQSVLEVLKSQLAYLAGEEKEYISIEIES
jgi:uncharacterized protein YsxB (DUF464 family)